VSKGDFLNLAGGTYYNVYVKDATGCVVNALRYISQPALISLNATKNDVSCSGGNNGMISLNVGGGVGPFEYDWSNGKTSSSIENLTAGVYSIEVTDHNGCIGSANFTINQPIAPLVVNAVLDPASGDFSKDGGIDITVTGGTTPYSYSWSNGSLVQDLDSLNPGNYTITITDVKGCALATTFKVDKSSGLIESQNVAINLYPNPATNATTISSGDKPMNKIAVFDFLGKELKSFTIEKSKFELETADLSNGIYLLKIEVGGKWLTKQLIIQK
jgi:hypothetical protein